MQQPSLHLALVHEDGSSEASQYSTRYYFDALSNEHLLDFIRYATDILGERLPEVGRPQFRWCGLWRRRRRTLRLPGISNDVLERSGDA